MTDEIIEYKGLIRAIIKKLTGNYNEDLEQDVYLKVWQNRNKYQEQGQKSSWLGAVTANLCRDYLKSRFNKTSQQTIEGDSIENIGIIPKYEEKIDKKKRQKIVLNAVNNLPKELRQAIILYEFEEKSYKEIAQKLHIAEGTVKSRIFNARKILTEKLNFLLGENK